MGYYRMGYSIERNVCSCWHCRGHRAIDTLMELTGEPFKVIKGLLGDLDRDHIKQNVKDVRGKLKLPRSRPLAKAHIEYLQDRKFDPVELAKVWDLTGIDMMGWFTAPSGKKMNLAWRILIPIYFKGEVVSWTTRTISERVSLRYISAPADCEVINHKHLIGGEDKIRHAVCVVEGPFDMMRIGPGAACTFGVGFSTAQVNRLARFSVRGVCFDNEPAAQERAHELVDMLSAFPGKTYNIQIDAKDPGSAPPSEIRAIRNALGL
jgi:hypothetical protein